MSKKVCKNARVVLGGVDVSEWTRRIKMDWQVGELYMAELDLLDSPNVIEITPGSERPFASLPANGGYYRALRVAHDDVIKVGGVDVSSWISGYDRITRVGDADTVRLYVQCDREVLTINGTTPWEEPA